MSQFKLKVLTHCSDTDHDGFKEWKESMDILGYDYTVLTDPTFTWSNGYHIFLKWAKESAGDYTHILVTDCFDVVAVGSPAELEQAYNPNMRNLAVWSVEKNSFPDPSLADLYPPTPYAWKYINCGQGLFPVKLFIDIFETNDSKQNIQDWAAKHYLSEFAKHKLYSSVIRDTQCMIFQSVAFMDKDDFAVTIDGRLLNRYTRTLPIFLHNNGAGKQVPKWMRTPLI